MIVAYVLLRNRNWKLSYILMFKEFTESIKIQEVGKYGLSLDGRKYIYMEKGMSKYENRRS